MGFGKKLALKTLAVGMVVAAASPDQAYAGEDALLLLPDRKLMQTDRKIVYTGQVVGFRHPLEAIGELGELAELVELVRESSRSIFNTWGSGYLSSYNTGDLHKSPGYQNSLVADISTQGGLYDACHTCHNHPDTDNPIISIQQVVSSLGSDLAKKFTKHEIFALARANAISNFDEETTAKIREITDALKADPDSINDPENVAAIIKVFDSIGMDKLKTLLRNKK